MTEQPVSRKEMDEIVAGFNKVITDNIQSMIREVFTAVGTANAKFDSMMLQQGEIKNSVKEIHEKVDGLSDRVSKNEEQILELKRAMFGDSRVASSPHIRKDIDRHESEIIGLNEVVRQMGAELVSVKKIVQEFVNEFHGFLDTYRNDMGVVIAFTKVSKHVLPSLVNALKVLLNQRWALILPTSATIGAVVSIVIEILKFFGLLQ